MVKVIFKNLKKSEFIQNILSEKISHVLEKFPEMRNNLATVSVEMENSPQQPGKDDFRVKLTMFQKGKPIVIQKESTNLYQAASVLSDRLFDVLHRTVEKKRDLRRHLQRRTAHWKFVG